MPNADLGDISIYYQRRGKGLPVLGVMGFALDARYWAPQVPAVTAQNEFITFDNRGIGRSTGAPPRTIDEMANDAVRLLDALEIEKAIVFGVSMGGAISQRIVLDNPDRVSGLILAVTWARPIEFMRRQDELGKLLIEHAGSEALIQASLVRMFSPEFFEVGQEMVDQMVKAFLADPDAMPDKEILLAQLEAIGKHDTLADLHRVECRTLVMGGKMDQMVPYLGSREIAAAIPNAELATYETGHGCMVEEMEPFNRKVSEFLRSLQIT
jgi:pimeloyl-ACP methyl ester carboxylesterase